MNVNDLKKDDVVIINNQPHKVLEALHMKKARQGATVSVKLKNLTTSSTVSKSFNSNERLQEAEIKKQDIEFIYNHRGEYVFGDPQNKAQRFSLPEQVVGDKAGFLKGGLRVVAEYFNDKIINIVLPIKVEYKVKDAPPNVRGNTAGAATKTVTIETGAQIQAPLFIEAGDIIRVNTEKGEYVERVEKSR